MFTEVLSEVLGFTVFFGIVGIIGICIERYIKSGKQNKTKSTIKSWLTEE